MLFGPGFRLIVVFAQFLSFLFQSPSVEGKLEEPSTLVHKMLPSLSPFTVRDQSCAPVIENFSIAAPSFVSPITTLDYSIGCWMGLSGNTRPWKHAFVQIVPWNK